MLREKYGWWRSPYHKYHALQIREFHSQEIELHCSSSGLAVDRVLSSSGYDWRLQVVQW